MSKIYLDKLKKKYNFKPGTVTGINYEILMQDILANQSENISRAVGRLSRKNYDQEIKKFIKTKKPEKRIILPDVSDVLPKRSVFLRKAAQDGKIITDNLRDKLTRNLRQTLEEFKTKTGEPSYIRRRGKLAGTLNPKVIEEFEAKIKETFTNYTKRDSKLGMPSNIHSIAVTEIRSTVDNIKHEFNIKLAQKNKDIDIYKIWKQNKMLAVKPRFGHSKVNGKRIKINDYFQVPVYEEAKNKNILKYTELMLYPHDPNASKENVISCNCEAEYIMVWRV